MRSPKAAKEKTEEESDVDVIEDLENKVVLYNDDVNTFDWVIECLIEICGHDQLQSEQLALMVHTKGKAVVKTGELDEMKTIAQALCDRGLSAVVE